MATLYYRGSAAVSSYNWSTLSNWFQDSNFTIPATSLPATTDDVVIYILNTSQSTFFSSNGSRTVNNFTIYGPPSANRNCRMDNSTIIINGNAIFNRYMWINANNTLTISGSLTFNSGCNIFSGPNTIVANNGIIFNGNSRWGGFLGTYTAPTATFNDNSQFFGFTPAPTINISSFIFNNNSINYRVLTGTATFSDRAGQYPGQGRILGNAIFPNSSYRYSYEMLSLDNEGWGVWGYFPIYDNNGVLNITGNITFTSSTPVTFYVGNTVEYLNLPTTWNLNSSSWVFNGGSPSWIFDNNGIMGAGGNIVGSATFTGSTYYSGGSISGNITFEDSSYNNGTLTLASGKTATFTESSFNIGTINGTIVYNGFTGENVYGYFTKGEQNTYINIPITVTNLAIFSNKSVLGLNPAGGAAATLIGNALFQDNTTNRGYITGNVTFKNYATNAVGISGVVSVNPNLGINGSTLVGI